MRLLDASQVCGAVSQMKWTPDGTALALSWERGGFSVWSVFGSLLLLSIGIDTGLAIVYHHNRFRINVSVGLF